MKHLMKQLAALFTALILCLSCAAAALAEKLFDDDLVAAFDLSPTDIFEGISIAAVQDTVFQLMQGGDIYAWDSQTNAYALYAHVPGYPTWNIEIPFSLQSDSLKAKVADAVICLIPSAEGIYGFNYFTGAIGLIGADGIHLNDVKLDVSALIPKGSDYPEAFLNAFVEDGKLYAYHDMNFTTPKEPRPSLLIFDLSTGTCTPVALPDTISFCYHTPGKLLFLQDNGTKTPALAVYDIASGKLTDLNVAVPISIARKTFGKSWYLHCEIGGLAYDAVRDIIYLGDTQGVWHSVASAPFERKTLIESVKAPPVPLGEAWALASGGYIFQSGWRYYVKP